MFAGLSLAGYAAGVLHLLSHGAFKALLFLAAGSVIHAVGTNLMPDMGGLRRLMPVTFATMTVGLAALAGIPPFSGFFSKDEILASAFARGQVAPVWYLIWALGTFAALLTAFYMTRLMIYTFHGPNRTGDAERGHLHESPGVMTTPLIVLAALTIAGGALNLPAFLPASGWLHHWLEPVVRGGVSLAGEVELSHALEYGLIGFAILVAVLGIWLAWSRLKPEALVPAEQSPEEVGFARVLYEKYNIDELYDSIIVRPLLWISRNLLWKGVDAGAIDGAAVNGSAFMARTVGWLGTRLQTGRVGTYVVLFVVGVLAVLSALTR
jgi:NADH-quinone oxidoreductase subunit L